MHVIYKQPGYEQPGKTAKISASLFVVLFTEVVGLALMVLYWSLSKIINSFLH